MTVLFVTLYTCEGWSPSAGRSSRAGIMSHNVTLPSDRRVGGRGGEGRGEWLLTEQERKSEGSGGNNDDDDDGDDDEGP